MAGFVESETWKRAVAKGHALGSGDVETIQTDDVDDLLACIETGSVRETVGAVSILAGPFTFLIDRMSHEQRSRLAALITSGAERALLEWPGEAERNEAFLSAWFCADRDGAVARLLALPFDELPPPSQKSVVYYLGCSGSEPAKARLFELYRSGGPAGKEAEAALELRGAIVPGPDRIQEVAARWREARRWQDLHWLYDYVIERLPPESPIQPILELLGPPSKDGGNEYYYAYGEGGIYLEADENGILRGTHRS